MSARYANAVWHLEIDNPARKLVLMGLAILADEIGECSVSQEQLAERSGCSARTVRTHLSALEDAGLIVRLHRSSVSGRLNDEYRLNFKRSQ